MTCTLATGRDTLVLDDRRCATRPAAVTRPGVHREPRLAPPSHRPPRPTVASSRRSRAVFLIGTVRCTPTSVSSRSDARVDGEPVGLCREPTCGYPPRRVPEPVTWLRLDHCASRPVVVCVPEQGHRRCGSWVHTPALVGPTPTPATMSRHSSNGRPWRRTRLLVLERDGWLCRVPDPHACTLVATDVDHIRPRQHGGTDELANLRAACSTGNQVRNRRIPTLDTGGRW